MRDIVIASLATLVLILSLSGCETTPKKIPLDPSFSKSKEVRIGVALVKYPVGGFYKSGPQGLLDLLINTSLAGGLDAYLQKINPNEFDEVQNDYVKKLQDHGFSVKRIDDRIDLEQFPKSKANDLFEYDLRSLSSKYDIDFLLLVTVQRFGTLRPYYGFIPTGDPKGLFQAAGQLINLKNNELEWQVFMGENNSIMAVDGQWEQPPDYPNVTSAIQRAEKNAEFFLETQFFMGIEGGN